jgi:hypothetical protein
MKENSREKYLIYLNFMGFQLLMAEVTILKARDLWRKQTTSLRIGSRHVRLRIMVLKNGSGFFPRSLLL